MPNDFLDTATQAARNAGRLLREHFGKPLVVDAATAHDIKLELDVRAQEMIASRLLSAYPDHALVGEEGVAGNAASRYRWIVDPIDGTVNYYYGIPHFCVSIALMEGEEAVAGVIYDPMREELWQAAKGAPATLNGKPARVSAREKLADAIVSVGFSKSRTTIASGLPLFERMIFRVRKCRAMGSAALDLAYVASGRLDAYIEESIGLWDMAAGNLIVACAGGEVRVRPAASNAERYSVIASNGRIDLDLPNTAS
jgi:myo-inositol-1(or 4)-monophosphatase